MSTLLSNRDLGRPIPMADAVGYGAIECQHQSSVDRALVLKHERLFLLIDPQGDIAPPGRCGLGLFYEDTRILSHYALRFGGGPPALLSSQAQEMFTAQIDLAIDDMELGGVPWDAKNVVHIRRELLLDERLSERVTLTNFFGIALDFEVELLLGCDFADIFEVRGWRRPERGEYYAPQVGDAHLLYPYRGRDGALVSTRAFFRTPPTELHAHSARWAVRLEPHQPVQLEWEIGSGEHPGSAQAELAIRLPHLEQTYAHWHSECTRWRSDVEEFDIALKQATTDLRALYNSERDQAVISAGIPWYSTVFGRDSILTSLQLLPLNPGVAIETLRYLARYQGREINPFTEEQPGKILHELRRGEMARAGEIPHLPYFGTIDATPLWIVLLHETWRWTGDLALVRELLPNAERALHWIDHYGDLDGDGLVEYARTSDKGLVNQGWKDSGDGVPFPDGRLPDPPIALVEVQGYVYDAKTRMASLYTALGRPDLAEGLLAQSRALRRQIMDRFWLEELGSFALALDGEKRPLRTRTTNAGHLLWSRVPYLWQAQRMAEGFLAPDMFSGWGIRTLSAVHPVYNPMSYHNGSVWPHDNAIVGLGMALYGETEKALQVLAGLHQAAESMRYRRLPELFCGMPRALPIHRPVHYPVSCSPQAWASGAFFMLLQAAMGILPDAPNNVVHIREPMLPPFLNELRVEGMRVGRSRLTLQFTRLGQRTLVNLLGIEGEPIQMRIELS